MINSTRDIKVENQGRAQPGDTDLIDEIHIEEERIYTFGGTEVKKDKKPLL